LGKAQIFSLDIVIAAGIFIVILLSTAALWYYGGEKMRIEESRNDMELITRNALAVLIETKGNPSNWTAHDFTTSDIQSLSLADEFLLLNQTKVSSLSEANYSTTKTLLGVLGPDYEFRLDINTWNGTAYAANYTIGLEPNASASEIVKVERFALLGNTWTKATIRLWKSCEDITC